jgi:hypothetical protein
VQFLGDGAKLKLSDLVWVLTMTVSCVPMTLSSVYKEKALGDIEVCACVGTTARDMHWPGFRLVECS